METARGNVISAQVFVSGERRCHPSSRGTVSIAMGQKAKIHLVEFSTSSHTCRESQAGKDPTRHRVAFFTFVMWTSLW